MNILFLSHAANRSGAPLVLLHLLRYLRSDTSHHATVLSLREGPLGQEWARVAEVAHSPTLQRYSQFAGAQAFLQDHERLARFSKAAILARRAQLPAARRAAREIWRRYGPFDAVYANSFATGAAIEAFAPFLGKVPLVAHIHELEWVAKRLEPQLGVFRTHTRHFIAASEAVKEFLGARYGAGAPPITTIHEWTDFKALETDRIFARARLRNELNVPDDAFLVGGCGTMEWRKGADLWAQVAARALRLAPNAHFVWLGGEKNAFRTTVEFDIKRLGIASRVRFLAPTSAPAQFFAALDAFALTSREDPFPLVAVEAAAQGVPVVCFENSGGAPELVGEMTGVKLNVPYSDVEAMAQALVTLHAEASLRERCGAQIYERAHELSDVRRNAPRVVALLESIQKSAAS